MSKKVVAGNPVDTLGKNPYDLLMDEVLESRGVISKLSSVSEVEEVDTSSSLHSNKLLSEIGIEGDIRACLEQIRKTTSKMELMAIKLRLDAYQKVVSIYNTAATTVKTTTKLENEGMDEDYDEIAITLLREEDTVSYAD